MLEIDQTKYSVGLNFKCEGKTRMVDVSYLSWDQNLGPVYEIRKIEVREEHMFQKIVKWDVELAIAYSNEEV